MSEMDELKRRVDDLEYKLGLALNVIRGSQKHLSRHFLDGGYDRRTWETFNHLFVEVSPTVTPTTTGDDIIARFVEALPALNANDVKALFREMQRDGNQGVIVTRLFGQESTQRTMDVSLALCASACRAGVFVGHDTAMLSPMRRMRLPPGCHRFLRRLFTLVDAPHGATPSAAAADAPQADAEAAVAAQVALAAAVQGRQVRAYVPGRASAINRTYRSPVRA